MSSTPRSGTERIVVVPVVELRRDPDQRAECVTECGMGARLALLEESVEGRWLRVRAPDGLTAWVRSWGVQQPRRGWPAAGGFVGAVASPLLAAPGTESESRAFLTLGCRVERLDGAETDWIRVAAPDGTEGWLGRGALEDDRRPAQAGYWDPAPAGGPPSPPLAAFQAASWSGVRRRLRQLLGAPYRWGGTTAFGLDCSGLIRLGLGLEGICLPRDSRQQAVALRAYHVAEDPGRVRPGDLVFFGPAPETADHVGIGWGGAKGEFLHASGRVRVSSLDPGDARFERALASRVCAVARPPWGA
jgi:SH3-like domain-containing protein